MEPPLAKRLILMCHATTRSMREGGFPSPDEAIDEGGMRKVAKVGASVEQGLIVLTGPERAARQTADALGMTARVEPALRDIGNGDWSGRRFADVHAADPAGFEAWLADPTRVPPGGESWPDMLVRIGNWLTAQAREERATMVIASPLLIRAMIAVALAMPISAALRIDIAPLSRTMLSCHRHWRLQAITPA